MRPFTLFASIFLAAIGFVAARAEQQDAADAHQFSFATIDGGTLPLATYRGKVLLIVNTASRCGYTPQYEGLQTLWQTYRDRGLVVIGVPSNDFGGQEPEGEGKILKFCQATYGVTFPLTAKQRVAGPGAHPFYAWAVQTQGPEARPRWNFHKYLVSGSGRLIAWFSSPTEPLSREMRQAVESALAAANASPVPAGAPAAGGS